MGIEWGVAALVLLTALIHASWNAVIKSSGDRLLTTAVVAGSSSLVAAALLPLVPFPARAAWPYLGVSLGVHSLYLTLLVLAYRYGDLSHVYPIARGLAPMLVAGLAAVWAGELLALERLAGLAVVSLGIVSLATSPRARGAEVQRPLLLALAIGVLIGLYTFLDGQGIRHAAGDLRYIVWHSFLTGIPLALVALVRRRGRIVSFLRREGRTGVVAGLLAGAGYAIILWALGRSSMALVSALRETSVIFAALIGTLLLGEPLARRRVLAAVTVAVGVGLLGVSR
ncbi:MAG: EamA family transporter [Myxococcota bacterium]